MQEPDTPGVLRYQQFKVSGVLFECLNRYSLIRPIGKGAYGLVCSADDLATNDKVAIKKISNVFDSPLDARRTLREIQLLRILRHENIVTLRDVFPPPDAQSLQDIYMVYDLLDTDLHQVIRSAQLLSLEHIKFMAYQLVRAMVYLHSAGVVHRDLKPSNLLLNANCDLKVCDFGLARPGITTDEPMPEYVVTRWYRAPELLLSCRGYGTAVDMWSVGCIIAEMLGRKPLFPGRDYIHTLNLVCRVVGTPNEEDTAAVQSEKARQYLDTMPRYPRANLASFFPTAEPLAVDLVDKLLVFNPAQRYTAAQALAHPYFAGLYDPSDEPRYPEPLPANLELDEMPVSAVRSAVMQEIYTYNPDLQYVSVSNNNNGGHHH